MNGNTTLTPQEVKQQLAAPVKREHSAIAESSGADSATSSDTEGPPKKPRTLQTNSNQRHNRESASKEVVVLPPKASTDIAATKPFELPPDLARVPKEVEEALVNAVTKVQEAEQRSASPSGAPPSVFIPFAVLKEEGNGDVRRCLGAYSDRWAANMRALDYVCDYDDDEIYNWLWAMQQRVDRCKNDMVLWWVGKDGLLKIGVKEEGEAMMLVGIEEFTVASSFTKDKARRWDREWDISPSDDPSDRVFQI
ncbi:hypothetical protein H2200_010725 [Cladophialophora chaetospira]|uniref:Uncharacterized protein n=1 Tax=Cladophialophora chaetospira TaxID=386627 RepID=A0AA39CDT4_9EURO|nr:hypothetical protein H2200_010725 [Cladophialophora chaetospira]